MGVLGLAWLIVEWVIAFGLVAVGLAVLIAVGWVTVHAVAALWLAVTDR